MFALIARKRSTLLDVLSKEVDRDKTTVFRCLQKLVDLRICEKDIKTLKEGGWYHVYTAIDIAAFKMERAFEEVKSALQFFIKQRKERKSRSIQAALYPILKSFLGSEEILE